MHRNNVVRVAVGVILNNSNQVLIAKRASHLHQGGLWEFPGGKIENGESVEAALARELNEEVGVKVVSASPYLKIRHNYHDKSVFLDVWMIDNFYGVARGMESQLVEWVPISQLGAYDFLEANRPILTALRLSRQMMITGSWNNTDDFLCRLRSGLDRGVRLVQLRAHHCNQSEYINLFELTKKTCDAYDALLIANTSPESFCSLTADGLHITSKILMETNRRPINRDKILGVSCHNFIEIQRAEKIEADYIILGPVYKTTTHPDSEPLGIKKFAELAEKTFIPVFALGGLKSSDLPNIIFNGGFGMAGISYRWGRNQSG